MIISKIQVVKFLGQKRFKKKLKKRIKIPKWNPDTAITCCSPILEKLKVKKLLFVSPISKVYKKLATNLSGIIFFKVFFNLFFNSNLFWTRVKMGFIFS